MATLTAINIKNQDAKRMVGSLNYITQDHKAMYEGRLLFSGHNCLPENSYLEMMSTKELFRKTDGILYYHYVQSFAGDENITPQEAHQIGLELAAGLFPEYEAVVATHVDTDNLHSHIIVNSVSFQTGRKLHQNKNDLVRQRAVNDKICKKHHLEVLPPYESGGQRMKPGEYRAMLRGDSWKLELIRAIEEALEYSPDRESFIANMEYEGYQVIWKPELKYITYITPEGWRCRDKSLLDETYLKVNMEQIFDYREAHGFRPGTPEPEQGWMASYGIGSELIHLGKSLEDMFNQQPLAPGFTTAPHSDRKQLRREALKKLAMGEKLSGDEHGQQLSW